MISFQNNEEKSVLIEDDSTCKDGWAFIDNR